MHFPIVIVNWNGPPLDDQVSDLLRNMAAEHLQSERKHPITSFAHPSCEGHLERMNPGMFGIFRGILFHADLGIVGGRRLVIDFLLQRGAERLNIIKDWTVVNTSTAKR